MVAAKFKSANEAQRTGRLDEAAVAYADIVKVRPNLAEAYANFGFVRYQQKRFDDAAKLFERALALKPELGGASLFLGISYYSINRLDAALVAFEAAVRSAPNDPQAMMWYGLSLNVANRVEEAAKYLDAAAVLAPNDVDILYHRGRIHLRISQDSYRQMFKADPNSARVHLVLGQSYEEAGRDAEASAEYEAAIKLAPTMPGVHEAIGSLYWKNAQFDEAEAAYEQELNVDPFNTLAMYKLGSIRVERGRPAEGMKLLQASIAQSSGNFDAYYYLGKAQGALNQNEAAIASLKKMLEGDRTSGLAESAYYQLSRIYRKVGRVQEAQAALQSFEKLRKARKEKSTEKLEEQLKKRVPDGKPQS